MDRECSRQTLYKSRIHFVMSSSKTKKYIKILRRILFPTSGGVYAVGVVFAKKKDPENCDPNRHLVRASDLPLYPDEKVCSHCVQTRAAEQCPEKNILEDTISCARKELWFLMDQAKVIKGEVAEALGSAMENTSRGLDFLREEENLVPRVGAIALGGITGLVFALRKRFLKKVFYTTVGAGAMAALCYPREAKEYSKEAFHQTRKYTLIAYHFLNGDEVDFDKLNSYNENTNEEKQKVCICPPKS